MMSPGAHARKAADPPGTSWATLPPAARAAEALVLILGAALCAAPLWGHLDDSDAHLYTVLARHVAEGHGWFDLSYLPSVHPVFREHLPFGIWPFAAALRLFGEAGPPALSLCLSVATIWIWMAAGRRLLGVCGGLAAGLTLSLSESFFHYGALVHLDRLLLFFTALCCWPLLTLDRAGPRQHGLAAIFAALAVLVKGPFGLAPLGLLVLARSHLSRGARELFLGALACLLALVPVGLFLLHDGLYGGGTWVHGYLVGQVLKSATGARLDAGHGPSPFATIAGRFWPGLPFALFGLALGVRDELRRVPPLLARVRARLKPPRQGRSLWGWLRHEAFARSFEPLHGRLGPASPALLLSIVSLLLLVLLSLPGRRSWHHSLIAWPLLSLLAAVAAGPLLERLCAIPSRARSAFAALAVLTSAALVAALLGAGARLSSPSCLLPPVLVAGLPAGTDVAVVAPEADWKVVALLAAEHRLSPWPMLSLPPDGALTAWQKPARSGRFTAVALVRSDVPRPLSGWHEEARGSGWARLRRDRR